MPTEVVSPEEGEPHSYHGGRSIGVWTIPVRDTIGDKPTNRDLDRVVLFDELQIFRRVLSLLLTLLYEDSFIRNVPLIDYQRQEVGYVKRGRRR